MSDNSTQHAEYVAVEVHIRTIPGRLMWLADHLETEGHKKGVRLGVAAGLRLIAEEMVGER